MNETLCPPSKNLSIYKEKQVPIIGNHNIFNKGKNKNLPSSLTQTEAAASQQGSYFTAPLSRFTVTKSLLESSCSLPESLSIAY